MTNYHAVHEGILIQSSANLLDPHPGWSFKFVKPASCFQQPSECAPPAPAPPGLSAEDGSVIGSWFKSQLGRRWRRVSLSWILCVSVQHEQTKTSNKPTKT